MSVYFISYTFYEAIKLNIIPVLVKKRKKLLCMIEDNFVSGGFLELYCTVIKVKVCNLHVLLGYTVEKELPYAIELLVWIYFN